MVGRRLTAGIRTQEEVALLVSTTAEDLRTRLQVVAHTANKRGVRGKLPTRPKVPLSQSRRGITASRITATPQMSLGAFILFARDCNLFGEEWCLFSA